MEGIKRARNWLEGKRVQQERLQLHGGEAEVIDISPENLSEKNVVLLAPAWSCDIETYKPALNTLAAQGRRVITLHHPRTGPNPAALEKEKLYSEYSAVEVRKALNLIDVLDAKGLDHVSVVAHSEGCINAVMAALIRPDKISNLVLYGPPGLMGKDNTLRLLYGFLMQNAGRSKSLNELPRSRAARYRDHAIPSNKVGWSRWYWTYCLPWFLT